MSVLLVLTGTYFSGVVSENRSVERTKFLLQALGLAEAGANHGISELRKRIRIDLKNNVERETESSVFENYVTHGDSLGFLRDFAEFSISEDSAILKPSPLNLDSAIQGNYNATIIVEEDEEPFSPQPEVYIFFYRYTIESEGVIINISPQIQRTIRLLQGRFTVTVRRDTFAKYALFTNHHRMPSGRTVWFTANTNFTGPLHTNERFSFANNPSASFTELVTQHLITARFYNRGHLCF
jgi:hypothetical protein